MDTLAYFTNARSFLAERMVDEMAQHVGERNRPTSEMDLPDADGADISVKRLAIEHSHGADAVGNPNGNDAPSTETAPRTPRIGRTNAEHECVDYRTN